MALISCGLPKEHTQTLDSTLAAGNKGNDKDKHGTGKKNIRKECCQDLSSSMVALGDKEHLTIVGEGGDRGKASTCVWKEQLTQQSTTELSLKGLNPAPPCQGLPQKD